MNYININRHYKFHFIDKETKAHGGFMICWTYWRSNSLQVVKLIGTQVCFIPNTRLLLSATRTDDK